MGNSRTSMLTSLTMNILNISGNALLVYGAGLGVAGVGISTLISRIVAAVIMLILIRIPDYEINIKKSFSLNFDFQIIKQILQIGIPNSLENSLFQVGKILVMSLVTSYGTIAIAANAVSNTIAGFATIPGVATGLALITIVGQCIGANDYEQAVLYTKKIMKLTIISLGIINLFIFIFAPGIMSIYNLSDETLKLAIQVIRYHSICCIFVWPLSFTLANTLRAANDAKFTMIIAIISMWTMRVGFSYVLGGTLGLGLLGVWIAMTLDWLFRAICFTGRFYKDTWKEKTQRDGSSVSF